MRALPLSLGHWRLYDIRGIRRASVHKRNTVLFAGSGARAAYAGSGVCAHRVTCCGECTECGHKLQVEGTFKVNPDKTRYLTATPQVRSVLRATEEGTESE